MNNVTLLAALIKGSHNPTGKIIIAPHRQTMIAEGWARQDGGTLYITDTGRLLAADYEDYRDAGSMPGTGKTLDEWIADRAATRNSHPSPTEDIEPDEFDIPVSDVTILDTATGAADDQIMERLSVGIAHGTPVLVVESGYDGAHGTWTAHLKLDTIWAFPTLEAARRDRQDRIDATEKDWLWQIA